MELQKKKPGPPKGYKHSVESRLLMRGRKPSPETIVKMKAAQATRRALEKEFDTLGVGRVM